MLKGDLTNVWEHRSQSEFAVAHCWWSCFTARYGDVCGGRGRRVCTLLCVTSPAVNWWTSQSRWESGTDLSPMCHLCSRSSFQTQNPDSGVFFTTGGVSAFGSLIRHTHTHINSGRDFEVEKNIFDPHMCLALNYNYAAFERCGMWSYSHPICMIVSLSHLTLLRLILIW